MIFFLFLLKTLIVGKRYNHLSEAVLTSTHNLRFGAKIRRNVYPCKPKFHYIKVGCKGYKSHGHVFLMLLITSDFSIRLMLFTSELQTPITFLFVNENVKCGYSFALLELDESFGTKVIHVC